jgi:hypothetical protein
MVRVEGNLRLAMAPTLGMAGRHRPNMSKSNY